MCTRSSLASPALGNVLLTLSISMIDMLEIVEEPLLQFPEHEPSHHYSNERSPGQIPHDGAVGSPAVHQHAAQRDHQGGQRVPLIEIAVTRRDLIDGIEDRDH